MTSLCSCCGRPSSGEEMDSRSIRTTGPRPAVSNSRRPEKSDCHTHSVRHVLICFCRWTSVRGMPHVVRSESMVMSIVWGVFVFIMLVTNLVLVGLLLDRYSRFNTIENIKTERNFPVEFPSVTVCNVDPVNTDRIYCLKNNTENNPCNLSSKYTSVLENYGRANDYLQNNYSIVSMLEDPSKISIFYQLIGMEAAAMVGHQVDDFIIRDFCNITYVDTGGNVIKVRCEDANMSMVNLINYKHFNCYTLTIDNQTISQRATRLSLVLYLDEEEELSCRPYCTHEFTEWAGGKVVVHTTNTYPMIDKRGMNLLPGASNQLLIHEMRKTESKNLRGNNCEKDTEKYLQILNFDEQSQPRVRDMLYTDELCIYLETQRRIMEKCQCIDAMLPIPGKLWNVSAENLYVFCGNISHPFVRDNLDCKRHTRIEHISDIIQRCLIPCHQLEYFVELTQLRWPQKPQILNYYKHLKDRIYYDRKFKHYAEIDEMAQDPSRQHEALKRLQNTNIFENNFLQLDVNRPGFDVLIKYKENEEYTLTTFLSQIGGICSMFLGVTFVTVLELLELLSRVIDAIRRKRIKKEDNRQHEMYPENTLPDAYNSLLQHE